MSRPRRSLRAFDDEAIAAAEPASGWARPQKAAERARPPRKRTAPADRTATTTRTGIYFHRETFENAKSAYLVDFDGLEDPPDSFARWIAAALDAHTARTAQGRTQVAAALDEEVRVGSGFTRSFDLPDSTVAAMEGAIATDRQSGRVVSRSEFSTEAIRDAIEDARARAGGVLPAAPARLPNKLVELPGDVRRPRSSPREQPDGHPAVRETTEPAAFDEPDEKRAAKTAHRKPARRPKPRWHVVQLDEADAGHPDAVVVVLSTNASEQAAMNTMSRMRSKHTGRGRDGVYYEVRRAADIRRRLEWDPDKGHGVEQEGPPPA